MTPAGTPTPSRAGTSSEWSGLLCLDKPIGVTSHDVVDRVRRRLRVRSVGHLGTLDPGASGLLILALGAATRCAVVWQGGAKTYEARLRFGVETDTQDLSGRVLAERPVAFDEARLRESARSFVGAIDQVPPMVSALKVGGERLYALARRGVTVERPARPVRVDQWDWLEISLPDASARIVCSGGTYVRTLAHDLGLALGSGAALASLRRLRSEPFGLDQAVSWEAVTAEDPDALLARAGVPLDAALDSLPALGFDAASVERLGRGGHPEVADTRGIPVGAGPRSVVFRDASGRALALGDVVPDPAASTFRARPHVVFPWAVRSGKLA